MAENLSDKQLHELREQLRQRRKQLADEVREQLLSSENEHHAALAGQVHDTEEESVADLLSDVHLALVGAHARELRDVEDALTLMDRGAYGVCVDCTGDIEYQRLQANPAARRCHDCQAKRERSYVQQGTPRL